MDASLTALDERLSGLSLADTWPGLLLLGIASIVLGALALMWPGATILSIAIIFGIQLVMFGAYRVVAAFSSGREEHRVWYLLVGVLAIVVGILCFRDLLHTAEILALALGMSWILIGLLDVVGAIFDRTTAFGFSSHRGLRAIAGVLSFVAGLVVISNPGISLLALTWVLGIWLLVLGGLEIMLALGLRRGVREVERSVSATSPTASVPRYP